MDQEQDSNFGVPFSGSGDGNGYGDTPSLLYPTGYNSVCPQCGYLNWLYGPEDGELLTHINNGHGDPDFDPPNSRPVNYLVPDPIPDPYPTLLNNYLNENSPAK